MTTSQASMARSGFDPQRAIFGQYATGVGVVTAISPDGSPAGMTINSLTSVSLGPPLVLWYLQRSSARFSVFAGAGYFGVSILAAHQERLARRFAARHPAPFRGLAWSRGAHGVPLLPGTLGQLVCRAVRQADGGDHLIIIGAPVDGEVTGDRPPLVFFGGRYHAALPAAGRTVPPAVPAPPGPRPASRPPPCSRPGAPPADRVPGRARGRARTDQGEEETAMKITVRKAAAIRLTSASGST